MFCFRESSTLEFYDANNFKTTVLIYSMAFRNPGVVCTAAPSILLYEDKANSPRDVHWLDCRTSPPKPSGGTNVTRTKEGHIWSMCCVQNGKKRLLLTTGAVGIYAYDTKSNSLEWSVTDKLPGNARKMSPQSVTTDHKGHVFISDSNNACVQMFSGADGKYLGAILKSESYRVSSICWNKQFSSMVVARTKNNYCDLTIVRITENKAERLKNKSSLPKSPKRLVSVSTKTHIGRSSSTTCLAAKSVLSKAKRNVVEKSLRKSTDAFQGEQTPLTKRTLLFSRPTGMMNASRLARSKAPSSDGDRDRITASLPKIPPWKKTSRMKTTPPWEKASKTKTTPPRKTASKTKTIPPWKKASGTKSSCRSLGIGTMTTPSSSKTSLRCRSTSARSIPSRTVINAMAAKSVTPLNIVTAPSSTSENNKPSGTETPIECIVIDADPPLKNKPSGTESPTEYIVIDEDPPVGHVSSAKTHSTTSVPNTNSAGILSGRAQVPSSASTRNANSTGLTSLDIPHRFIPLNWRPTALMTPTAVNNMMNHPLGLRPLLNVPPKTGTSNIQPSGFALDCITGLITDAVQSTVQPAPIQSPEYEGTS